MPSSLCRHPPEPVSAWQALLNRSLPAVLALCQRSWLPCVVGLRQARAASQPDCACRHLGRCDTAGVVKRLRPIPPGETATWYHWRSSSAARGKARAAKSPCRAVRRVTLTRRGQRLTNNAFRVRALEELAKHYEHREKNYARALELTCAALNDDASPELRRREERLRRRVENHVRPRMHADKRK